MFGCSQIKLFRRQLGVRRQPRFHSTMASLSPPLASGEYPWANCSLPLTGCSRFRCNDELHHCYRREARRIAHCLTLPPSSRREASPSFGWSVLVVAYGYDLVTLLSLPLSRLVPANVPPIVVGSRA